MSFLKTRYLLSLKSIIFAVGLLGNNIFGGAGVPSVMMCPEYKLASYFKEAIGKASIKPMIFKDLMRSHYQRLELLSSSGEWVNHNFQKIGEMLLPNEITQNNLHKFVDDIATAAKQNSYLHNALTELEGDDYTESVLELKEKVNKFVPDLVAYAMVLENMTKAMSENPEILKTLYEEFEKQNSVTSCMKFGHKVKYYSVRAAIAESLKAHTAGKIPGGFSSFLLPLNIAEASLLDMYYGNFSNASAGWTLVKNGPGNVSDDFTGAAPASFEQNGGGIALHMPF